VINKQQIAELKAMLTSMGANLICHDDKIEAHDRQIEGLIDKSEAHDRQIEGLIRVAQEQTAQMKLLDTRVADLVRATENLERQWQAYINTLPRQ
jgi:hypothetical protein